MKTFITVLVLIISSVFAVPYAFIERQDACDGFRITSPTQSGLQWTNGQCYQISFDGGNSPAGTYKVTSIDLIDTSGNIIQQQWTGSVDPATQGYTPNFNLNLGSSPKNGDYKLRLYIQKTDGSATCNRDTVTFTGIYNQNSGFDKCP
ncbi:1138_t:CDS:2 [Ambispora leptoticha]|uniref:1138_t:CDS:1 n=1 Tax=Ambispora leptoticha TaxID=144679 RepID=A0A9N9H2X9_9GLOM|nr:1138_t:CDS:2 [Ambispora leptoticha]